MALPVPTFRGLGPAALTIGETETVLPVVGQWDLPPQHVDQALGHSGLRGASHILRLESGAALSIRVPWWNGYNTLSGLRASLASIKLWASTYDSDGLREALTDTTHELWTCSAGGVAYLGELSARQGEAATVEIIIIPFGAFTRSQAAMPTLATPVWHTLGPLQIGSIAKAGVVGWSLDFGTGVAQAIRSSGQAYPDAVLFASEQVSGSIDLLGLDDALDIVSDDTGLVLGASSPDPLALWLRGYNASTRTLQTTGQKITIGPGLLTRGGITAQDTIGGRLELTGLVDPATGAYPLALSNNSQTVPTE